LNCLTTLSQWTPWAQKLAVNNQIVCGGLFASGGDVGWQPPPQVPDGTVPSQKSR